MTRNKEQKGTARIELNVNGDYELWVKDEKKGYYRFNRFIKYSEVYKVMGQFNTTFCKRVKTILGVA